MLARSQILREKPVVRCTVAAAESRGDRIVSAGNDLEPHDGPHGSVGSDQGCRNQASRQGYNSKTSAILQILTGDFAEDEISAGSFRAEGSAISSVTGIGQLQPAGFAIR